MGLFLWRKTDEAILTLAFNEFRSDPVKSASDLTTVVSGLV